eukprot:7382114-Prymnesium_polylepis.2
MAASPIAYCRLPLFHLSTCGTCVAGWACAHGVRLRVWRAWREVRPRTRRAAVMSERSRRRRAASCGVCGACAVRSNSRGVRWKHSSVSGSDAGHSRYESAAPQEGAALGCGGRVGRRAAHAVCAAVRTRSGGAAAHIRRRGCSAAPTPPPRTSPRPSACGRPRASAGGVSRASLWPRGSCCKTPSPRRGAGSQTRHPPGRRRRRQAHAPAHATGCTGMSRPRRRRSRRCSESTPALEASARACCCSSACESQSCPPVAAYPRWASCRTSPSRTRRTRSSSPGTTTGSSGRRPCRRSRHEGPSRNPWSVRRARRCRCCTCTPQAGSCHPRTREAPGPWRCAASGCAARNRCM